MHGIKREREREREKKERDLCCSSWLLRSHFTLSLASHADVLRGSSRVLAPLDEPLRTFAWEATLSPAHSLLSRVQFIKG